MDSSFNFYFWFLVFWWYGSWCTETWGRELTNDRD
jgi:hypothetical protein